MAKDISCNPFVWRQTPESRFSHYEPASGNREDTFTELEALVAAYFDDPDHSKNIAPDGKVRAVTIPVTDERAGRFFSGIVKVDETTTLKTVFAVRQGTSEKEAPYMQTVAVGGKKLPARHVEIIVYNKAKLTDNERMYTPDGADEPVYVESEWQIVSINASPLDTPAPPTPQAMARNSARHYELPEGVGGSARVYTDREWMESQLFWSRHAMAGE